MSDRILLVGDGDLTVSEDFRARLRQFDASLNVYWNRNRKRFVIEQCVQHRGDSDHATCKRMYVMTVEDPDGDMLPLGDHVFDKLRLMRAEWAKYGPGDEGAKKRLAEIERVEQERDAKRDHDIHEIARLNSLDHRIQLNKVRMLMNRHDMRPNQ